jgi:cobalt/nickel transport protein
MIDNKTLLAVGLVLAIVIGTAAVFLASGDPDGLESTALLTQGQKTLAGSAPPNAEIRENMDGKFTYSPLMPGYSLGERSGPLGGVFAIVAGTIIAFCIAIGLVYTVKMARKQKEGKSDQ